MHKDVTHTLDNVLIAKEFVAVNADGVSYLDHSIHKCQSLITNKLNHNLFFERDCKAWEGEGRGV